MLFNSQGNKYIIILDFLQKKSKYMSGWTTYQQIVCLPPYTGYSDKQCANGLFKKMQFPRNNLS